MTEATFKRIGEIIAKNPRISNYTITGYKYSGTRLVLHFVDCNQVFDFDEVDGELQVTSFYTAKRSARRLTRIIILLIFKY